MSETVAQIESRLTKVRTAIDKVLSAQSYSIGQHSMTKAQLDQLMRLEKQLELKLSRMTNGGAAILSDFSHDEGAGV